MADMVSQETVREKVKRTSAARLQEKRQLEDAVAKDVERRRSCLRNKDLKKYTATMFFVPPRQSDMTFWYTRIGDPPCLRIPEEKKASRVKTTKVPEYETNCFRLHALHDFVYWMRRDQTLRLSRGVLKVRGDSLHLNSCNSLGSIRPDWRDVRF